MSAHTARLTSAPAEVPRTGDEDILVGEHLLLHITDDGHVLWLRTVLVAEVELGSRKVFFRQRTLDIPRCVPDHSSMSFTSALVSQPFVSFVEKKTNRLQSSLILDRHLE